MTIKSKLKFYTHKFKKAGVETTKQVYYDNFSKVVMPESITEFPHNLLINNDVLVHTIVCGIPPLGAHHDGYPRNMKDNIIDILHDIDADESIITLSETFVPIDRVTTGEIIQNAVVNNDMKSILDQEVNDNDHPDLILDATARDLAANFQVHHEANQNMFDSIVIIVIYSRSDKDLRIAKGKVVQKLDANLILHESPTKEHMKAFLLAMGMPMPDKETGAYRIQIFSRVAAVLSSLRVQNDSMSSSGLYFGDLKKTNKNLLINLDDQPAKHMLIFGSTGSGKTVGMLTWCMRAHDMLNYRIIYMTDKADAQTDYRNIVKSYGKEGQIIDIGPGLENVNPMQIFYEENKMGDSVFAYEQVYDLHKGTLKAMYEAWRREGLTTRQESLLDMHIDNCYEQKGILRSVPSTWSNEWPLMEDLIAEFKTNEKDVSSQALYDMSYPLGPKGELNFLNRATTVNFDRSFMILDLSSVPESFKKAQNVLVMGIISLRFRSDNERTTIIAVDEAGSLMRDPKTTSFLLSINTKGRSADIGLWLGTQQPQDIIKAGVWEQMGNNMFVVCLFGRKSNKKGVSALSQHFSLDEDSQAKLITSDIGECLIMVENNVYHTKVKLSPFESNILLNSKTTIQEPVVVSQIDPAVYKLSIDHGVFFKDLGEGDLSVYMEGRSYESRRNQDPIGRGMIHYWINSALIHSETREDKTVEFVGVQSIDHYITVMRIACFLANEGIKVQVNQTHDVDIVIEIEGKQIAFEYERPGSHSRQKILDKNVFALGKYDTVYFITTSANYDAVEDCIGSEYVVKRGVQLRELLDGLIS